LWWKARLKPADKSDQPLGPPTEVGGKNSDVSAMKILNDITATLESETAHHEYRPRVKKSDRSDDRSPSWRALANTSSSVGRSNEFERWSFDVG
jgi:hypothetical protein